MWRSKNAERGGNEGGGGLEAAIGIEPMNKGFAEIFSRHSQNTMDV
jgi:hypothetical protein